jgi:hypothetical protein
LREQAGPTLVDSAKGAELRVPAVRGFGKRSGLDRQVRRVNDALDRAKTKDTETKASTIVVGFL